MKGDKKYINESGSFNVPNKPEREKSFYEDFILKLLGRVFLTKKVFFGMDEQKIAIIITPTLKIVSVVASPSKLVDKFPQKRQQFLNGDELTRWAEDNGFEITFIAPTPQLKHKLFSMLGDVMVSNEINESIGKDKVKIVLQELKKSSLPESIKKWAIDNPEKFIKNIEQVKNLLN